MQSNSTTDETLGLHKLIHSGPEICSWEFIQCQDLKPVVHLDPVPRGEVHILLSFDDLRTLAGLHVGLTLGMFAASELAGPQDNSPSVTSLQFT